MKETLILLACILVLGLVQAKEKLTVTKVSGTHAPKDFKAGDLIFEENFDTLDLKKWQHENTLAGGGNWEFQWYTNNRSNSYTENGILHIRPTFVSDEFGEGYLTSGTADLNGGSPYEWCTNPAYYGCTRTGNPTNIVNPIKSARIRTLESFSFTYGKVEIRAKIPSGDWLWPAIWMLPKYDFYSTWPASGEIDIMESRGNKHYRNGQGQNLGTQLIGQTLHWGPNWNYNQYPRTHWEKNNDAGFDMDYHNYQMEWTPDYLALSIDNEEIGRVTPPDGGFWQLGELDNTGTQSPWKYGGTKMAPFDQEFYIILNLAVGGVNFFPDGGTNDGGDKPWQNNSPQAATDFWNGRNFWEPTWNRNSDDSHLKVDYVRVWAL